MKKLITKVGSIPSTEKKADSDMQPIAGSSSHNLANAVVGRSAVKFVNDLKTK